MKKLLLIAFAFLFCGTAISQIFTPVNPTTFGQKHLRTWSTLANLIPSKDTVKNTSENAPQLFYFPGDSTIWAWSIDRGYFQVGGGLGISTNDSIFVGGLLDTITFPAHPSKKGIIVPVSILDSLLHKFIDTGVIIRNNYVLAYDSTNHKWKTVAQSSSSGGTVTNVATGYGLSGGPITSTGTIIVDSAALSLKYLRIVDTANIRLRAVAGTNITITGTYPNLTFNASSSGTVTSVTGTAPIVSSGGTTPVISADTSKSIGRLATFSDNALKINISDSAAMLGGYYSNLSGVTGGFRLYNPRSSKTDTVLISVPAQFNPTAGNGISITGTYPNMTFTALAGDTLKWTLLGNSITAGTHFLGTTNNTSLRFRSNNTEYAVLDSNGRFGIGVILPSAKLDIKVNGFAATPDSSHGIFLHNDSLATLAIPSQYSPALTLSGNGWKSSAIAVSQNAKYRFIDVPITGGAAITSSLLIQSSLNYGAWGTVFTIFNNGFTVVPNGIQVTNVASSGNVTGTGITASVLMAVTGGISTANSTFAGYSWTGSFNTSSGTNLVRGIYLNPTVSNTYGLKAIGIENTVGNNLFGTTSGSTGVGANSTIDSSAILDVTSTTKGFLIPRMTTTQRTNIIGGLAGTLSAGTGQTNTTYAAKALTGGTGTGATADITVAGGVVTVIIPVSLGAGYVVGDVLSASGMGGTPFTFTLTTVKKPAEGLTVYDLTLHKLYTFDGTIWQAAW